MGTFGSEGAHEFCKSSKIFTSGRQGECRAAAGELVHYLTGYNLPTIGVSVFDELITCGRHGFVNCALS